MAQHALMFGRDHGVYDQITTARIGNRAAATISAGADPTSPSLQFKGDRATPNEDALCVFDDERLVVLAVADAHFGIDASHVLISRLAALWAERLPADLEQLEESASAATGAAPVRTSSETTLVAVVLDRQSSRGFGLNFGDSTVAVVSSALGYQRVNVADRHYVGLDGKSVRGIVFSFDVRPGDMVIMHTDGVDECHYNRPATSVQPHHVVEVVQRNPHSPVLVAEELARRALDGVDGNPGGQDNVAVITALA